MNAIFLVDNGSLRPEATFNLRRLAAQLSERSGQAVQAVSLLHSNKIPSDRLEGQAAITLGPAAERAAAAGVLDILVVPLFFAPSRALTDYLPERMARFQAAYPRVRVRVAMPLVDEAGTNDLRLARLLAGNVREQLPAPVEPDKRPSVVLVDHGSPAPEVTAVRNRLAGQLGVLLEGKVHCVVAASMERRPGEAFRFNEPLLEHVLQWPRLAPDKVILAMLFLSPGRHAGEGGDVHEICADAVRMRPALTLSMTRLAGENDALVDILMSRLTEVENGACLLTLPARNDA